MKNLQKILGMYKMVGYRNHSTLIFYVASQVVNSWVAGTLFYMLWSVMTKSEISASFSIVWLVFPTLIMLFISPLIANFAETATANKISLSSFILRFFGMGGLIIALMGLKNQWNMEIVIASGLFLVTTSTLDRIFHSPVPFILTKTSGLNLVRFRVSEMLFLRGANVVTPTIALLLLRDWSSALYLLLCGGIIGLGSSFILSSISRDHAEKKKIEEDNKPKIGRFNLVIFYAVLLFSLNCLFAHTTSIMLASHAWKGDVFAYRNAAFFTGFVFVSILLVYKPNLLSSTMHEVRAVVGAIAVSLAIIGLGFGSSLLTAGLWDVVPISIAGVAYGGNLHFVTTVLPSYLGITDIYKTLNHGRIGATMGSLISGIWVGFVSVSGPRVEIGYMILLAGSFVVAAALGFIWAFVLKKKRVGH